MMVHEDGSRRRRSRGGRESDSGMWSGAHKMGGRWSVAWCMVLVFWREG